ncbi:hypothetical protein [uncultured Vagococcus sp.]|uniref:hypothetical protein n=1 Tax=uncultured Vagococcus sp. TaxID=189676 RepID=UPI0028D79133|nr:hypothetical protein [uncultured Vagococcus sp.]
MNLIIEMTDNIGMDYYYVTMYCEGQILIIDTPDRRIKELRRQIPICALEEVHWQVNGSIRRLVFRYQNETYSIVDMGTIGAIAENLMIQTLV